MSFDNKTDLIQYRIDRAKESFTDACVLAENDGWNSCINRLYYACFYAASALLLKENLTPTTHNGVKTKLSQHFVKTEKLDIVSWQTYAELFNKRHKGDYDDFFQFDELMVKPYLAEVKAFIETIEKLLVS